MCTEKCCLFSWKSKVLLWEETAVLLKEVTVLIARTVGYFSQWVLACFHLDLTKYLAGLWPGVQKEMIKEAVVIIVFPLAIVICHLIFPCSWVKELLKQLSVCPRKTEGAVFIAYLSIPFIYRMGLCVPQEIRIWMAAGNSNGRTELVANDFLRRLLPLLLFVLKDWDIPCSS